MHGWWDARLVALNEDTRPVVVAFDGSPEAAEAVRAAGTLFRDRPLLVVTVWEPGLAVAMMPAGGIGDAAYVTPTPDQMREVDQAQREHATATAEAGARLAVEAGGRAEPLPVADDVEVAGTIAAIAEQRDAAAVVVGSRGLGRVKSALLGSTSRRLLHETRRPLLVVRAPDRELD
jgi:nucleotide-binding universal stress UspA family protein